MTGRAPGRTPVRTRSSSSGSHPVPTPAGAPRREQLSPWRSPGLRGAVPPPTARDRDRPRAHRIDVVAGLIRREDVDAVRDRARIDEIVKANPVVLFMKGTALFPQCGFSSRAVAILDRLGVPFETVDVLQDPEIRDGIKAYSDWPTIPQLYVKGEFVGGSDIMMEMFESGELQQLVGQSAA